MQGTLFFDEADVNAVINVCQQKPPQQEGGHELSQYPSYLSDAGEVAHGDSQLNSGFTPNDTRYSYKQLTCSGSLLLPELGATLSWWLDDGTATPGSARRRSGWTVAIHLVLVSGGSASKAARNAQTKKLSVELPVACAEELLTCGVTKLVRGGCYVSVAWLTTSMEAGCMRVVLQRDADACGTLMLTPEGKMVKSLPIRSIASSAASGTHRVAGVARSLVSIAGNSKEGHDGYGGHSPTLHSSLNDTTTHGDDTEAQGGQHHCRCGPHTSACTIAEIPTIDAGDVWERYDTLKSEFNRRANPTTQPSSHPKGGSSTTAVAAIFVVTDGAHLWRVKLLENGLTSHIELADNKKKEQVGLLCAQLNRAAAAHGHGFSSSAKHPLFSELSNLQRVMPHRGVAEDSNGGEEGLTFASMSSDDTTATAAGAARGASSPKPKGWFTRFLGGSGKTGGGSTSRLASAPPRRFLCVSAVLNSPFVAVLRWSGLIELYDSDLATVQHFPTCYVAPQVLAPAAGLFDFSAEDAEKKGGSQAATRDSAAAPPTVQQWSTLVSGANAIHYFASFGTSEGRRCVWARVPAVECTGDEKVMLRCTYGVLPPASGSAPMACAVNSREELAVLWDVGVEEDAHLLTTRSISSLFRPGTSPASAALQIVKGTRGAEEAWVWRGTDTYLCHGSGRLLAVLSEAEHFFAMERTADFHRAYVLQPVSPEEESGGGGGASTIAALVETIRVNLSDEPEDESDQVPFHPWRGVASDTATSLLQCVVTDGFGLGGFSSKALHAMHLVPTTAASAASAVAAVASSTGPGESDPFRYFMEGCNALESCAHGATLLSELLRDALTSSLAAQQLMPALSQIVHEAHLAGYAPSCNDGGGGEGGAAVEARRCISAAIAEAVRVFHSPAQHCRRNDDDDNTADALFCSFSRHYILHTVLRSLLNRVAFLVVTLIGVSSSFFEVEDNSGSGGGGVKESLSIAVHAMPASGDNGVMALVQAIQLLAAAYHAAHIAGPELPRFALASTSHGERTGPTAFSTGNDIVRAILARFTHPFDRHSSTADFPSSFSSSSSSSSSLTLLVIQVANGLRRCRTPRTDRASAAWATQLQHAFSVLRHFRLLADIDAGRTMHSTQQQDMCMRVVSSLASLGEDIPGDDLIRGTGTGAWRSLTARCLLDEGFLVADALCCSRLARLLVPGSSGFNEVRAWATERATLAPKLYAVGILRRLVPVLNGSSSSWPALSFSAASGMDNNSPTTTTQMHALQQQQQQCRATVSVTAVRCYYLIELSQVRACVASMQGKRGRQTGAAAAALSSSSLEALPAPHAWSELRSALDELLLDSLIYLAQCAVSECDFDACWHDLAEAVELAEELDVLYFYADSFNDILAKVVERACSEQRHLDRLIAASGTTDTAVSLEELLVVKWYNAIARMPTKSASDATEALRYRSIMGLYRYLMSRHAYAQCGRVMSDLASLLRCSPLRRTDSGSTISVSELAALALSAVELIAPTAPVEDDLGADNRSSSGGGGVPGADGNEDHSGAARNARALHASPISSGFAWRAPPQQYDSRSSSAVDAAAVNHAPSQRLSFARRQSSIPGSAAMAMDGGHGALRTGRLLSRLDLPWLRRRVYQAHCERQLWRRGSTLDCADIWVDGAPREDYLAGVWKLTNALEVAELWPEAYRFATLAEVDSVPVLQHWAVHLTRRTRRLSSAAALAHTTSHASHLITLDDERRDVREQWRAVVQYCHERSSLSNQFAGFSRVLLEALTVDYESTAPELRDAHRRADPYTAAVTLLQVFAVLDRRLSAGLSAAGQDPHRDEEEGEEGAAEGNLLRETEEEEEGGEDGVDRAELGSRREALRWLPWAHAAQICTEVLHAAIASPDRRPKDLDVFTAGVVDPIARHIKRLPCVSPEAKALFAKGQGEDLDRIASNFMRCLSAL